MRTLVSSHFPGRSPRWSAHNSSSGFALDRSLTQGTLEPPRVTPRRSILAAQPICSHRGFNSSSWRAQLSLRHTGADLILGGESGGIITRARFRLGDSAPSGSAHYGHATGAALHLLVGVVVDR